MKKIIIAMAMIPIMAQAQEAADTTKVFNSETADCVITGQGEPAADTTIVFNNKKIIVSEKSGETTVSVFKNTGEELTRTYETGFTDGQEVERVFVTSPFLPNNYRKNESRFKCHIPTLYMGGNFLAGSVMGTNNNAMHSRDSKSWEWGLSLAIMSLKISSRLSFISAYQTGQVHHHFQDNYVLTTSNGITSMRQVEGETVKKSYIAYGYMRVPFIIEWARMSEGFDLFAGIGASIEYRQNEHSSYFIGNDKYPETRDININPVGVNLEAYLGYGRFTLYCRTALTPLMKTDRAPKGYPVAIGFGLSF